MPGITWRELPLGASEPPPLSIVRDRDGDLWCRTLTADDEPAVWAIIGATDTGPWDNVSAHGPLHLAQHDDDVLHPLVDSVEPSEFEIRDRALAHAAARLAGRGPDVHADARLFSVYRRLLRGENSWPADDVARGTSGGEG